MSWQQGKPWIDRWLERIDIPDFGIMGGEPLINPECRDWLIGIRQILPNSQIRFTTNGLLLEDNWDILDLMHDLGNVSFKITVHLDDQRLEATIDRILSKYSWKPVKEYGIDRFITDNNFRFHIKRPETFVKSYRNDYKNMAPWHSDIERSFAICVQQTCPLLYDGKIYKCSTSGLLSETLKRFNFPNKDEWMPYITPGIDYDCDQKTLEEFVHNFGKAHSQCGQCPSDEQSDYQIVHLERVKLK